MEEFEKEKDEKLDNKDLDEAERASLESELSNIIIKLARFK